MGESNAKDVASLKVSIPLVPMISAEVPIRWSLFQPLKRLLLKAPAEQLVRIVGARSQVRISADDDGSVDTYLQVVNMTDRALRVDDLHLDLFYVGGVTTSVAQPLFRASDKHIAPFDAGEVNVTISLGSGAIRALLQRMQKAQNVFSSPGIALTVGGRLHLFIPGSLAALQRAKVVRLPFTIEIHWPEMHINCPSARTQ